MMPIVAAASNQVVLPVSAVIPTADRPDDITKCLDSLTGQSVKIKEIIIVDASKGKETKTICENILCSVRDSSDRELSSPNGHTSLIYLRSVVRGAASQRNEGVATASQEFILFMDDDVELQQGCLAKLWEAITSDGSIGGANSMIINQKYFTPGTATRIFYRLISGKRLETFAGKCLGPVLTVLPEDREDLPEVVPVEWLNAGCTLYRRAALPFPVFPPFFTGYSLGEDVNLSLTVAKRWKLVNARTARLFHNGRAGAHKSNPAELARMSLVNRHYIMTKTLGHTSMADYVKLAIAETFGVISSLRTRGGRRQLPAVVWGKLKGVMELLRAAMSKEEELIRNGDGSNK